MEGGGMANLFEAMARHRPEWLAQGLLMRAVAAEPVLRSLLRERLGWELARDEVPIISEEEVTEGGWRADISVAWKDRTARLELKLLAGFTYRQEEALRRRAVDLLVLKSKAGRELPAGLPVLTWDEIAEAVSDPCLKRLLGEVSTSSTWVLEEISGKELEQDFDSFLGEHEERSWRLMYRFLSTVHQHLLEGAPMEYRASDGWTCTPRAETPYYGFCFWLGDNDTPRFWLGFWRSQTTKKPVFGLTVLSVRGESVLLEEPARFAAGELAGRLFADARDYSGKAP
jgi:hypothetical protein